MSNDHVPKVILISISSVFHDKMFHSLYVFIIVIIIFLFTSNHTHKITKFHSFLYVSEAKNGSPKARLIVWLGKTTFLRIAITFNAFPSFFVFVWQKKPFHLKRWAYYSCGCPWGYVQKPHIISRLLLYPLLHIYIFSIFFNGYQIISKDFYFFWNNLHRLN